MALCQQRGIDLHAAQLMPLPLTDYKSLKKSICCIRLSKIQTGFTFLVLDDPGTPGQRAVKWVCVCVCPPSVSVCPVSFEWMQNAG